MRQRQPAETRRRGLRVAAAVVAAVMATGFAFSAAPPTEAMAAGGTTTVHYSPKYAQTRARNMLGMVNSFRKSGEAWWYTDETKTTKHTEENLSELKYDADLEAMAMQRAAEIGLLFSHIRPDGTACSTALPSGFTAQGENIAVGYETADRAMQGWLETDEPYSGQGHRRNMLSPDYNAIGVAHVIIDGVPYWVQELGKKATPNETLPTPEDSKKGVDINVSNSADVTFSSMTPDPASYMFRKTNDSENLPVVTVRNLKMSIDGDSTIGAGVRATVDASWGSAASSVAKVQNGKVVAAAAHGETKISATVFGTTLEVPVSVQPFTDVNPDTDHEADIYWMFDNGITTGFLDGTFRPYNTVVRCDMAAFLFRVAKKWGLVNDSWRASSAQQKAFVDIQPNTPHSEEVWWLASQGITTGWEREDGKREFRPYENVKRQDMAAFLFRLAKKGNRGGASDSWSASDAAKKRFKDVSARDDSNHHKEIWWLAEKEISTGWPAGKDTYDFRPLSDIARCDMAAFLHRLAIL